METSQEQKHQGGERCLYCGKFFRPRQRQKACLDPECQKKRKQAQERKWLEGFREKDGKGYGSGSYDRIRQWREANPGYQRKWRAKRRREIHNADLAAEPIKPVLLRLRIPSALRLSEIQTLTLRLTRSGRDFLVDGGP